VLPYIFIYISKPLMLFNRYENYRIYFFIISRLIYMLYYSAS
jgi:hypothetical protein